MSQSDSPSRTGYVAFIDVLGFSALVANDRDGRLEEYLQAVNTAVNDEDRGLGVEYVVFSDSIVLTSSNLKPIIPLYERITRYDWNCSDFSTWQEAQSFYQQMGGPTSDPYRLDADRDGIACEHLPGSPGTTRAQTRPAAPTNFSGQATGHNAVTLGWTDNADSEDGYRIETRSQTYRYGPGTTRVTISGVSGCFTLYAYNQGGDSYGGTVCVYSR